MHACTELGDRSPLLEIENGVAGGVEKHQYRAIARSLKRYPLRLIANEVLSNLATLWGGLVEQRDQGRTNPQGGPLPHAPGGPLARAHPIERSEPRLQRPSPGDWVSQAGEDA